MLRRVLTHTVDQPDCDISAFFISCGRLDLLEKTVASFLATRDLPTKMVFVDDSGDESVFRQLVESYGDVGDIICFPRNRSLWWAKDFMVSYCDTPYIFYIEEDWQFLKPGYLSISKYILMKYRQIGSVDISWRTFEEEGLDSYDPTLVDDCFYYKRPWRISENHLHWFIWQGSPNLKRRDDLLLLGRVEKYYNEWNVDRKFFSLGFKGAFVAEQYVTHLGDNRSIMVGKRPHEHTTPESLFPSELKRDRIFPELDYYGLDQTARELRGNIPDKRSSNLTLVTGVWDIQRSETDGRSLDHYLDSLRKIIATGRPLILFGDEHIVDQFRDYIGKTPIMIIGHALSNIQNSEYMDRVTEIVSSDVWQSQAPWMRGSIICDPNYIMLTLYKMKLLKLARDCNWFNSERYYWIDAGICSSFNIDDLSTYNLSSWNMDGFNTFSYPYSNYPEMHGLSKDVIANVCGFLPQHVCRASFFGGTKDCIPQVHDEFYTVLEEVLGKGGVGTEEAILTVMESKYCNMNVFHMYSGDVKRFLNIHNHFAQVGDASLRSIISL